MRRTRPWPVLVVVALAIAVACHALRTTHATNAHATASADIAEFWVDPRDVGARDLLVGVGGRELAPDPAAVYTFAKRKTHGTSPGLGVRDPSGRRWSVKLGAEAQPEVVVSRLLWAVGYHQPPTYYLPRWTLERDGRRSEQSGARFRPALRELRKAGYWAWQENPFVGTRPYRGLLVLNILVNNWDLKTSQDVVYELAHEREGARRWYVVRDVGASLGRTPGRILDGTPNDLAGFEQQGFITEVKDGHVRFDYRRPHTELLADITPEDVRWACELLARISPRQWSDAFRAGGYGPDDSARYVRKLQAKIAAGRALAGS